MKFTVDTGPDSGFDMAPMIDMVFLLLIFFMCVSRISASQSREMTLATATEANIPDERPDRLIINIDIDKNIYIGGAEVALKLDDVRGEVKRRAAVNPRLKISIRCDANAEVKTTREVIGVCAEAGIDNIIFATNKEEKRAGG